MPAGNFADVLNIGKGGEISPQGPLTLESDEELLEVYAWVTQVNEDRTGAACTAEQSFKTAPLKGPLVDGNWTIKTDAQQKGQFYPGNATGTGLLISKDINTGATRVFWWKEDIKLVVDKAAFIA